MVLMPIGTPAVPPVTLADAKAHLRVTHEGEDTLIAELVDAAARFIADDTGLALIDQTWRLSLSEAPAAPVFIDGEKALTLRGETQPVTLKATNYNCYQSPMIKKEVCGGDFETSFKRSAFGMKYGLPFIPDDVRLVIQIEAVKQ